MPRLLTLPIICVEGIGDSLLAISRVPISFLGWLGFRFQLYYTSGNPDHPTRRILEPFFKSIRYVEYQEGQVPTARQRAVFQRMSSLTQRVSCLWAPPIPAVRPAAVDYLSPGRVVIQTHLDGHHGWKGATAKIWCIERWIETITALRAAGHEVSIMEWDAESRAALQTACPGLEDVSGGDFLALCRTISRFDLMISIDSWSKYVADWYQVKQVVIVPNLQQGYTEGFASMTADWIASWWFHGLLPNPNVAVIGLTRDAGAREYRYSLSSLDDLTAGEVVTAAKRMLAERVSLL